jgi:hypothetical protein
MISAGTIEVKHAGATYSASYCVKNGKVHLVTPLGSSPPKPAGNSPEAVARFMLKTLLHERDKR